MKTKRSFGILLVALLLLIALSIYSGQKRKKTEKVSETTNTLTKGETNENALCFLYKEPADSNDSDSGKDNIEYIKLVIADDNTTTGTHLIAPYEETENRASLIGVSDGGFVNVIASYTRDNKTWEEQRVYKLEGDRLLVGYQPVYVPRYQNDQGIYFYEDINQLKFETDDFYLSKVDCASTSY